MASKPNTSNSKGGRDLASKAYEGIRGMLFRNEISPGQKISYRDIAKHLGMSSTPVVLALTRLQDQGLVRHEPNRGYFTEPMSMQEIREIYELRELIELSLLPEVVNNLKQKDIEKIHKILQAHSNAAKELNLNERINKDIEFHLTIASISGRRIQLQTLRTLFDLLYLKYRGSIVFVSTKEAVGAEHQHVFDAIKTGDLQMAEKALKLHFTNVKKQVFSVLQQLIDVPKGPIF